MTLPLEVIDVPERAQVLLHPVRIELLENLAEPCSAATLATRLRLPRQRLNYHLHELESQQLIEVAKERRKGSCIERLWRRTAEGYALSTAMLGGLAASPEALEDELSADYQIALASQAVHELAALKTAARASGKSLATFALAVEVRFASAASRHAFASELATAVADLVRKHHDESASGGRRFRFYLGAYPRARAAR